MSQTKQRKTVAVQRSGSTPPSLTQSERINLMMPLAEDAKRLLRVAKAKRDIRLMDCAIDTFGAIIEAV